MTLATSPEELAEMREELRACGSVNQSDKVTLTLASDNGNSTALQSLGDTTAILTLHNPTARNALTGQMMAQLADHVTTLETNPALQKSLTAVLVRGGGDNPFFCAGADLGVAAQELGTKHGGKVMSAVMADTTTRLRNLPYLTVACIEGGAVGGGAELATATDYRFMTKSAMVRFVQARMGVTPGWGGATRLVQLVGRSKALQVLGTAAPYDAEACVAMGLVDHVVDSSNDEDMDTHVVQFLQCFVQEHPSWAAGR